MFYLIFIGRACWSLGNVNLALGNHEKALYFASKHLEISKEVSIILKMDRLQFLKYIYDTIIDWRHSWSSNCSNKYCGH